MKLVTLFSLLTLSFFFAGCASSGTGKSGESAAAEEAPVFEGSSTGAKTAYEGSTGSGLLMVRYKAGRIEGFRN